MKSRETIGAEDEMLKRTRKNNLKFRGIYSNINKERVIDSTYENITVYILLTSTLYKH